MRRREFLQVTCTAAVSAFAGMLHADAWSRAMRLSTPAGGGPLLASVGFAEDWDALSLRDARALSGDGGFLGGDAQIEVRGLSAGSCPALNVDALYTLEGGAIARFHAAAHKSVPVRFTMPVHPVDGVQFEISAGAPQAAPIPLSFAVNSNAGTLPLRRGVYVVVLHDRTSPPQWRALKVTRDGVSQALAVTTQPALLLGVDYVG